MIIHLHEDVQSSPESAVNNGRFASIDDALATAWRNFEKGGPAATHSGGLGSIGALREESGRREDEGQAM
jgi:hypothetical protein